MREDGRDGGYWGERKEGEGKDGKKKEKDKKRDGEMKGCRLYFIHRRQLYGIKVDLTV